MEIDLVLSGSGMLFPCHLGAYAYLLEQGVEVKRVAGTSGGSIVSAGIAHGWTVDEAMALMKVVTTKNLLDLNWTPWRGVGIHKGDLAHAIFREHLPGKMSDAEMSWGAFVVDVWKRQSQFVASDLCHAAIPTMAGFDLPTADVIRASISIPIWFKMAMLKRRPQVDGGVKMNFGLGVWDDEPERPTVGVRFKSKVGEEKRTKGVVDNVKAIIEMFADNANHTYVSKKRWPFIIEVESEGDSMDFSVDDDWVERRFEEGWNAAEKWWSGVNL